MEFELSGDSDRLPGLRTTGAKEDGVEGFGKFLWSGNFPVLPWKWLIHTSGGVLYLCIPLCSVWAVELGNIVGCRVGKQLVKCHLNGKHWDVAFLGLRSDPISVLLQGYSGPHLWQFWIISNHWAASC